MYKTADISANTLTKQALKILDMKGYEVWRNNNLAVRGRTFNGRRGVSDITGFHRSTGKFIACEVKAGKDRLTVDQAYFLDGVRKAGGIAIVVKNIDDLIKI